jgi:predicted O-methyltransferase YrrM
MEHYYQNIQGWFTYPGLFQIVVEAFPTNSHFVEIGCWRGMSSTYFGVEILNSGKNIKLDCVDTWLGAEEHQTADWSKDLIAKDEVYTDFIKNIEPIKHIITPIRMTSLEASKLYADNSLDFVFIDAAHDYENVKADLIAWYPKVKNGGMFAGHDYPFDTVKRAVHEFFQDKNGVDGKHLRATNESCWTFN